MPKLKRKVVREGGAYFASPKTHIEFIHSGCTLLDCAIGGGWPLGRVSNIVGDKSTGKTLLAIEATANMVKQFPKARIFYRESEAAFDQGYANALGMPLTSIDFWDVEERGKPFATVEDFFEDISDILAELQKSQQPALYIIDSLDALSDREELEREIDKGSYGANKPKKMSETFRRVIREVEASRMHLMVISQVRANMNGGPFSPKHKRSGGAALDFYASQVVHLHHLQRLTKTVKEVKRAIGIHVSAKVEKNKISLPYREAEFDIMFGYGIDDLRASLVWLEEVKRLGTLGKDVKEIIKRADALPDDEYHAFIGEVGSVVRQAWTEIETGFLPTRRKY